MRLGDISDKLILFLCCAGMLLLKQPSEQEVIPVIISAIVIGLLTYYDSNRIKTLIIIAFAILCLFFTSLCFFIPVIFYSYYGKRENLLILIAFVPPTFSAPITGSDRLFIVVLLLLAFLLKFRAINTESLTEKYHKLYDTNREISLGLKHQNESLLEKQDEEIRIATLNERNRIAREIHDHVGHQLSSALLQIGALLAVYGQLPQLLTLKDTLGNSMDSIRKSVHNLHCASIELRTSIETLVKNFTFCSTDLIIRFETEPELKIKYALIAIIKEALSNTAKHSDATTIRISLTEHPAFYQMIICDNGNVENYDPDRGIGLKNMAQRINGLNGHFLIRTQNGFELFITIPKT